MKILKKVENEMNKNSVWNIILITFRKNKGRKKQPKKFDVISIRKICINYHFIHYNLHFTGYIKLSCFYYRKTKNILFFQICFRWNSMTFFYWKKYPDYYVKKYYIYRERKSVKYQISNDDYIDSSGWKFFIVIIIIIIE